MTAKNQPISNGSGAGRGGARKGAGRPKGAETRRTRLIAQQAAAEGVTPLEYMLRVMRDESVSPDPRVQAAREAMRFEAAKAAAQYCHPRLTATTIESLSPPAPSLSLSPEVAAAIATALNQEI